MRSIRRLLLLLGLMIAISSEELPGGGVAYQTVEREVGTKAAGFAFFVRGAVAVVVAGSAGGGRRLVPGRFTARAVRIQ